MDLDLQELQKRFERIEKEISDTRKQMIKNANVIGNLVAEAKEISKKTQQERKVRWTNSLAAYLVFVLLIGGFFFALYEARVERIEFEKTAMRRQYAAKQVKWEELIERDRMREKSESQAMAFYQLMRGKKIHQALKEYPSIAKLPLSKVEAALFQHWTSKKRTNLAYKAFSAGMKAAFDKDWKKAATELERSLKYEANPPQAASLHYYYGVSLSKIGNNQQAVLELEHAIRLGAEKKEASHVRYILGGIYEALSRRDKAKDAYEAFLKRESTGNYAKAARRRLAALK